MIKLIHFTMLYVAFTTSAHAQTFITKSIKDFGARGDGVSDDQDAFVKASGFFNARKGHGKLIIPKGTYLVGRQKFTGDKKNSHSYTGEPALDFDGCRDMIIHGDPGAIIRCRNGLRIGAFSPFNGEPFMQNIKDINIKPDYANYSTTVGIIVNLSGCSNISITGLQLQGNFDHFIFGGRWGSGRNPYEIIHYGIYVIDTHDLNISNCTIDKFAADGIYIANRGQEIKTYKIKINKCKVNYCGRNGLSWLGGQYINVTNSEFSNSGQGLIHESPAAGIDIEVENNSLCRNGYFFNCRMENNVGSGITSGSKNNTSNIIFKNCIASSPLYYSLFVDADSHSFENCSFYGTVLVWTAAENSSTATRFKGCLFSENYKKRKMYDGSYLFGAEATALVIDSCTFKAFTIPCYYLAGHSRSCDPADPLMIHVSNSIFSNYSADLFKGNGKNAGTAGHTLFYNNRFYSRPGFFYQNGFGSNCNGDAGRNEMFSIR